MDDSGSDGGMFPTVSTEDGHGEADSVISLEFLGLKSFLRLAGDSNIASGLDGRGGRWMVDLPAMQLDPISKITLLFLS
jgi:hypothetical protein